MAVQLFTSQILLGFYCHLFVFLIVFRYNMGSGCVRHTWNDLNMCTQQMAQKSQCFAKCQSTWIRWNGFCGSIDSFWWQIIDLLIATHLSLARNFGAKWTFSFNCKVFLLFLCKKKMKWIRKTLKVIVLFFHFSNQLRLFSSCQSVVRALDDQIGNNRRLPYGIHMKWTRVFEKCTALLSWMPILGICSSCVTC